MCVSGGLVKLHVQKLSRAAAPPARLPQGCSEVSVWHRAPLWPRSRWPDPLIRDYSRMLFATKKKQQQRPSATIVVSNVYTVGWRNSSLWKLNVEVSKNFHVDVTNWTVSRVFVGSAAHPLREWDVKIVPRFFEISADRTGGVPWNCWGLCRFILNERVCVVRREPRCAGSCAWVTGAAWCPTAARGRRETLEAWLERGSPFVVFTHLWKQFEAIISTCSWFMWLHVSNRGFILSVLSPTFPVTSASPSVWAMPWVCLSSACPSAVLHVVTRVCVRTHTYVYVKTIDCHGSCFSRIPNRIFCVKKGNVWL